MEIDLSRGSERKLYGHGSTWLGWKTRGLAHWLPLRKLSLRRSSSLNHLTESSWRSTSRPSSRPRVATLLHWESRFAIFFIAKCQSSLASPRRIQELKSRGQASPEFQIRNNSARGFKCFFFFFYDGSKHFHWRDVENCNNCINIPFSHFNWDRVEERNFWISTRRYDEFGKWEEGWW